LKRRLKTEGVFEPQLAYYGFQALFSLALLASSFAILLLSPPLSLKLLDAALLAVAFTRLAYFVHDAGHRQIFRRPWQNDYVMLLLGVLIGSSSSWWSKTHNQHHVNPNDLKLDPNTALPIFAFSEQQARERTGLLRIVTRFQVYYFVPILLLEGFGVRVASIQFLITAKPRYLIAEALGMAAHFVLYGLLVFTLMPVGQALLFVLVHQCLAGLYMGSVFAPNHKGMLVPTDANRLDFLHRQVLCSRNIRPHPLVDFWYGGLNYQIEHHLFPTISRNKLKQARTIVRDFCGQQGIPYHETSVWQSYVEVFSYFHRVVAPLRLDTPALSEVGPEPLADPQPSS
jgi:fatty acid desaturase